MGIEETHNQLFPIEKSRVGDENATVQNRQARTDKKTIEKTRSLKLPNAQSPADNSLKHLQAVHKPLPKSFSLLPLLSSNRSLAIEEGKKAADNLKPGRFTLFGDTVNGCLAVQTKTSKFKYTPNQRNTFSGAVQNRTTGKWSTAKYDLGLNDVLRQFGGICDLISLERLPLASASKIKEAHTIQPGQFILLRNKDQSVLAIKKAPDGKLEQTRYAHGELPGTFVQNYPDIRLSLSEIVRDQGGIENLCLNKLEAQSSSLAEPLPVKAKDLPPWDGLTWDTHLRDFKVGEFALFQDMKDGSVVVCMNKGKKGTQVDKATNHTYSAPHYVSYSLSTAMVNGKETYVDSDKKSTLLLRH